MTRLEVEVHNAPSIEARLLSAPVRIEEELFATTVEGTAIIQASVAAVTPVHTGKLVASEHSIVEKTLHGARGRVMTDVRYARYVEYGTHEHGGPQRMLQRGLRLARGSVENEFKRHIGSMVARLR